MDLKEPSVTERIKMLVEALDGEQSINESLSQCDSGESMIEILLEVSSKLRLGLSRDDLTKNPPIRDWIWWKNKEALLTIGGGTPRHQQDASGRTRWDLWSLKLFKLFKK